MESRSSLRQLHQHLGDLSLAGHTLASMPRNNFKDARAGWHLPDKRAPPPLPSLPPWAARPGQPTDQSESREEHLTGLHTSPPTASAAVSWKKPRPYFKALKELPAKQDNTLDQQLYQDDEPVRHPQLENQDAEREEAASHSPNRPSERPGRASCSCVIPDDVSTQEDEQTSGNNTETNQQEEASPRRRSPLRGQFFRPWKKSPRLDVHDDSGSSGGWSPPASNKWKERAIMDPFAKRRARVKQGQSQPHPEPKESQTPAATRSPRLKTPEYPQLNPLRLSSADRRRAHRPSTPIAPSSPVRSARLSRDTSSSSLSGNNPQEPVGLAALRVRHRKAPETKPQPKRSTLDALSEIKRKREARRALQAEEKRRVQKELREHGDDAGYKFRRLIQQYRDALPASQQQLPPISLSSSIRPPPTPTQLVDAADAPRLSVFIRKRPLAKKELKAKGYDVISCLFCSDNQSTNDSAVRRELVCHEPKLRVDCSEALENHQFRFDGVFDEWQENAKVYEATVGPMVPFLVAEASSSNDTTSLTVFAYGQTGSGKTYTMKSIYRQAAVDLFQQLDERKRNARIAVGVSFYEIYMNSVNDLLNGRARVQLMEDGDGAVQLPGLKELPASSADELLELVQRGEHARATSANAVHDDSSRSHALLRVTLYAGGNSGGAALARLSMVDLAGSERASDTQSDKKSTRMEGAEINKSLLALKECIRALDRGATHIPFRQSKLTQLLRDSFLSQNSKTIMIATVSPCSESCNHTLNTLRYADRLKEIGAAN